MVKIGDLCPLFFNPIKDRYGIESDYMQTFYKTDRILIQIFAESNPYVELSNLVEGSEEPVTLQTYQHNTGVTMYYAVITGKEDGIYSLVVENQTSEPFCITSDVSVLKTTTLIRYSHKDNNSVFDNIFWIGDEQQIFEWRVEAGFKSQGYAPHVDNEQYRNQFQEIKELYSIPYDSFTLTFGNAGGVPYWYIRHLNRVLCVSTIEIDDKLWVRSESSVPEVTQVMEELPMFYATVILEPITNEVSGNGGMPEEASSSSVVGFSIDNPSDGQMLQYSEDENAFVNVTTVGV